MKSSMPFLLAALLCSGLSFSLWAAEAFFPPKTFDGDTSLQVLEGMYAHVLKSLGERPLPPLAAERKHHVYRFTCVPSFEPQFCLVLTVHPDGSARLKRLIRRVGSMPLRGTCPQGELVLGRQPVDRFVKMVEEQRLWLLKATEPTEGLDGSHWLIEAVRDGRYHLVERWSPRSSTALGRIGRDFSELAEWKVPVVD
ncbi:MAG: hypothetical protein HY735_06615 [Verrucomicrobia bacterium]|nr:hypothetical protein [Verrucomicrobiota bacterium]